MLLTEVDCIVVIGIAKTVTNTMFIIRQFAKKDKKMETNLTVCNVGC